MVYIFNECTLSHSNQKLSKFNPLFIGTDIARPSQLNDPASQKLPNGSTITSDALAKRSNQVSVKVFSWNFFLCGHFKKNNPTLL